MSAAEESFHHGEVRYEEAARRLIEAAGLLGLAASHFGEAGGEIGRRRAVEAYNRASEVSDAITAVKLTIAESQGYHEETVVE